MWSGLLFFFTTWYKCSRCLHALVLKAQFCLAAAPGRRISGHFYALCPEYFSLTTHLLSLSFPKVHSYVSLTPPSPLHDAQTKTKGVDRWSSWRNPAGWSRFHMKKWKKNKPENTFGLIHFCMNCFLFRVNIVSLSYHLLLGNHNATSALRSWWTRMRQPELLMRRRRKNLGRNIFFVMHVELIPRCFLFWHYYHVLFK